MKARRKGVGEGVWSLRAWSAWDGSTPTPRNRLTKRQALRLNFGYLRGTMVAVQAQQEAGEAKSGGAAQLSASLTDC